MVEGQSFRPHPPCKQAQVRGGASDLSPQVPAPSFHLRPGFRAWKVDEAACFLPDRLPLFLRLPLWKLEAVWAAVDSVAAEKVRGTAPVATSFRLHPACKAWAEEETLSRLLVPARAARAIEML